MYLFRKFKIIELIDKLNIEFEKDIEEKKSENQKENVKNRKKISDKIKINEIVAKSFSYYVFLVFFRLSIVVI
jgi:hypothetical protein